MFFSNVCFFHSALELNCLHHCWCWCLFGAGRSDPNPTKPSHLYFGYDQNSVILPLSLSLYWNIQDASISWNLFSLPNHKNLAVYTWCWCFQEILSKSLGLSWWSKRCEDSANLAPGVASEFSGPKWCPLMRKKGWAVATKITLLFSKCLRWIYLKGV